MSQQFKPKLTITESREFSTEAFSIISSRFNVRERDLLQNQIADQIKDSDVIWITLRNYIGQRELEYADKIKTIVTATTGIDCIDVDYCDSRGIKILSLRGETEFLKTITPTAELTLALMLCSLRNLPKAIKSVPQGEWNRDVYKGHDLAGQKVGIVGMGRLGSILASYLAQMGANVFYYEPFVPSNAVAHRVDTLNALFASCKIISVHAPSTLETFHLIGREQFESIQDPIYFFNTARGELVDEDALLCALQTGKIIGGGIDVLSDETHVDISHHPLVEMVKKLPNFYITPHIGGCTHQAMAKTQVFMAEKLIRHWQSVQSGAL